MSNIHFNTHSQTNQYSYQQQPTHHHHHQQQPTSSQIVSPTGTVSNVSTYSNQYSVQTQPTAYFLDRIDLDNYQAQTLKQIVETILSKTKPKGLKVKLSLPNDGLIIDNLTDSNQSWIFKTSELLYFWRDSYYSNIIAVITRNRSRNTRPYSASIFRLRGNESAQHFLQQAQQFFSKLSTIKSIRAQSTDKIHRTEPNTNHQTESKSTLKTKSSNKIIQPIESTTIRRVTRAEFDPGKVSVSANARTRNDTISSTDSRIIESAREIFSRRNKSTTDDDEQLTNNNLSHDQITDLMRELKTLRNEITVLKLEKKAFIPARSVSTSPLTIIYSDKVKQTNDSSTTTSSPSFLRMLSDVGRDAQTQTDFSLTNRQRQQIKRKNKKTMIGTSRIMPIDREQISTSAHQNNQRTISNSSSTTISDSEDGSSDMSSQTTQTSSDTASVQMLEHFPSIVHSTRTRSVDNQNSMSNEDVYITNGKEKSNFLSQTIHSPTGGSHFLQSKFENLNPPIQHIYENVPIFIQSSNINREHSHNVPIIQSNELKTNTSDDLTYYTINNSTETQLNSPPTTDNSISTDSSSIITQQQPQIISTGRHRNQPIYFANHLTNPIFNIDKQLLINTIANQFGIDLNSPQLQQLITNQHLFAARKRTFANMIWQLTPDEEMALYSSIGNTNQIHIDSNDSKRLSARSILKLTKKLPSKRRSITWDNTVE